MVSELITKLREFVLSNSTEITTVQQQLDKVCKIAQKENSPITKDLMELLEKVPDYNGKLHQVRDKATKILQNLIK
jgi:flagellar biosynthesis chaperone FliJ